jgi:putative drug exporter of the RND superfamily
MRTGGPIGRLGRYTATHVRVVLGAWVCVALPLGFFSPPLPPKEMGIILGIAVLLDAALVRLRLVPVVLRLLGAQAWWLPKPLHRVPPNVRFGHA